MFCFIRFFTGHTEDSNGKPLFQAGKTKVGDAINEIVKIFAIAVGQHIPFPISCEFYA